MKKTILTVAILTLSSVLSPSSSMGFAKKFTMDIWISSGEENVNAFGGELDFPKEWSIEEIVLRSPDLLYWIVTPSAHELGRIKFSGILPGGSQHITDAQPELALFTVKFFGESEQAENISFVDTEFYLNHPTALKASTAGFIYKLNSSDFFESLADVHTFKDVNYSFEKDPVTLQDVLVVDTYRGNLASYEFSEKEGSLWFGEWATVDGVQNLQSSTSTILLNIRAPNGEEQTLTLRASFFYYSVWFFGLVTLGFVLSYLFYSAYKILKLRPEEITRK